MTKSKFGKRSLGFIITIVALIVLFIVKHHHNRNAVSTDIRPPQNKTFTDIKRENFTLYSESFEKYDVSVVFIEYKFEYRHALLIRRDSTVGVISIHNPELNNQFYNDRVGELSITLLNTIEEQYSNLQFEETNKKTPFLLGNNIVIYIKLNSGANLHLSINKNNYEKKEYAEILSLFIKVISEIKQEQITIDELI